jgi:hypothetical protein
MPKDEGRNEKNNILKKPMDCGFLGGRWTMVEPSEAFQ